MNPSPLANYTQFHGEGNRTLYSLGALGLLAFSAYGGLLTLTGDSELNKEENKKYRMKAGGATLVSLVAAYITMRKSKP